MNFFDFYFHTQEISFCFSFDQLILILGRGEIKIPRILEMLWRLKHSPTDCSFFNQLLWLLEKCSNQNCSRKVNNEKKIVNYEN